MTQEKSLSDTKSFIELMGQVISYALHARGVADDLFARVMLAQIGSGLQQGSVLPSDCLEDWRERLVLVPNDHELIRVFLEGLFSTDLPEEFVLLERASAPVYASLLSEICRLRQREAIAGLFLSRVGETEDAFDEVKMYLNAHLAADASLPSVLPPLKAKVERWHETANSLLVLCRTLYDIAIKVHGSGKLR